MQKEKPKHVLDYERVPRNKGYSYEIEKEGELLDKWYECQWQTVVFGTLIQGDLHATRFDGSMLFTIKVQHGNKTLHIEGPFEDFVPVEEA